ncbi:XRE family transcriptional regulator [Oceanospirillaceae bacterium ASx5O]|nr:XRE family transcriptional regulator [Oceanospirillaceae bacterium ASx5O]
MEYDELKRQIGKAGLTNKAFAELIGINPNSVTNFKRTKVPSNIAIIAVLIAEMKEHGIDFEEILNRAIIK